MIMDYPCLPLLGSEKLTKMEQSWASNIQSKWKIVFLSTMGKKVLYQRFQNYLS